MVRSILPLGVALLGAITVAADPPSCSLENKCPKEAPCCSQYNQCGVGAFCLGGCDPRMSFSLDSCVPAPVCESKTYKMDSLERILDMSEYLGDPEKADWVGQGKPLLHNGNVLLTMPPKSVGTVLATTRYMWYGSVKAKLKTSRGKGVVTAFILFSDVKDEIDYEFVGVDLSTAQTNYYFQGIPDYDNSGNISVSSDIFDNFHDYEIQWTPETITWLVDGKVGRTKKKSETWNATAHQWNYPQTPSRVQISLWPGGLSTNGQGTIDWAGGLIDWDSEDIKNYGYDYATFGQIDVECYDASSGAGTNKHTSYTYNNIRATNDTVIDGDKPTILKSFSGTGLDMDAEGSTGTGGNGASGTGSSGPVQSLPGGGSGGGGSAANGGGSGGSGSGGSGTSSSPNCKTTGFSQKCEGGSTGGSGSGSARVVERTLGASAFAVVVAIGAVLWL